MEHASVAVYRAKPGRAHELTRLLVAEVPRLFCHRQGFVAYDLIKAGEDTLLSLSTWDSEEQARTALHIATAWHQQHLGDLLAAAETYVGDVPFSWHQSHLPVSP